MEDKDVESIVGGMTAIRMKEMIEDYIVAHTVRGEGYIGEPGYHRIHYNLTKYIRELAGSEQDAGQPNSAPQHQEARHPRAQI